MYSRHEASRLKKEFWTTFGQYMKPVPSAEGEKINWLNYKTREKYLLFKMDADNRFASVAIELTHADAGIRELYFQQFLQLKNILSNTLGEAWLWQLQSHAESGREVSRIYTELTGRSIYNKEDWPSLISFFKPRMIALDDFWSTARYSFEALR